MAWYVFALVDALPSRRGGKGLTGPLSIRKLSSAFVVVERRADVPPVEFGTLKKHQDVVTRLAGQVPAILPVRFGTLLEPEDLEEAVQDRDDEIAEAFDLVRGRVQFTWREARGARREARSAGGGARGARREQPKSGAEYLRRAARAANPPLPPAFKPLRARLRPLIIAERFQPATTSIPDSLYHLVDRPRAERYAVAADALKGVRPTLIVTGPFPPFAFTSDLL